MAIQFKLNRISVPQFAILKDERPSAPLYANYEINFSFSSPLNLINNSIKIDFKNKNHEQVMVMEVDCYYEIAPDSWTALCHDDIITAPKGFLQNLAGITLGTTRGILYSKTEMTNLKDEIIPLMDMTQIITSDITVDKKNKG